MHTQMGNGIYLKKEKNMLELQNYCYYYKLTVKWDVLSKRKKCWSCKFFIIILNWCENDVISSIIIN